MEIKTVKEQKTRVRIPPIISLETAIRIYYENIEIGNKDIIELFDRMGSQKVCLMKPLVRTEMTKRNTPIWDAHRVNTKVAYSTWGLNIDDFKKRYNRLKKLNFIH